jgi:hypothetical protein
MESKITLESIVNYLIDNQNLNIDSTNNDIVDRFNLKFLEYYNSSNFHKFNNFFQNHIDRVGMYNYTKKNTNISLLSSILFCIDEDFCTLDYNEQCYYNKYVINRIITDTNSKQFKINNLSNKMIISNLKNLKTINNLDIYIYASYFKSNIFIFDFIEGNIKLYYPETEYNIYKTNIFISKNNDQYNPLTYKNDNGRIFKFNSSILEDIIYNNKINIFTLNDKEFIISNNWDILLKDYQKKDLKNIIVDITEESNILLQQMIDSDESCDNIDYDCNNIDLDNLTDELEKINNETKKITEIDSDNMSLTSNESNCIEVNETGILESSVPASGISGQIQSLENIDLFNEVKKMSKSKLLKQKKDILIGYMVTLFKKNINDIKPHNKSIIVNNIQNELKKNI